ncbi:hypothetical protein FRC06_010429, partial [Ceratobasidium sp. 370]
MLPTWLAGHPGCEYFCWFLGVYGSVSPRSFAGGSVLQALLEDVPVSSIFYLISDTAPDPYEPGYPRLSYDGFQPTPPSSAVAPIRGLANGLSTSATSLRSPLPAVTARPGNGPGSTGPSHHSRTTHDADTASSASAPIPTPVPATELAGEGAPFSQPADSYGELVPEAHTVAAPASNPAPPVLPAADRPAAPGAPADPSWASQCAWILIWVLPLAVHLGLGIGLYFAQRRLVRPEGDETPQHARQNPPSAVRCPPEYLQPPALRALVLAALLTRPAALPQWLKTPLPSSLDSPWRLQRCRPRMRAAQDARVDQALEELSEAIGSAPRREEETLESDAPVASSSVEKQTGMR